MNRFRRHAILLLMTVWIAGWQCSFAQEPIKPSANQKQLPLVVMLIAEREYQTEKTLPQFAAEHLDDDYRVKFVYADDDDPNRLIGIEAVVDADVLLVSVRRRTLPTEQLDLIRSYVADGKPVVGIRTASHAFSLRNQDPPDGYDAWPSFDQDVFGGNYSNHYSNDIKAVISASTLKAGDNQSDSSMIGEQLSSLNRHQEPFVSGGSLYQVVPLLSGSTVLLSGKIEGHPSEPVAWTFQRKDGGRSFYTSLGHVDDFRGESLPKWLHAAIDWAVAN
ncbi:ThuA domain-containing protein [Rubripirellula amarantea]|uniref:Trehalose utilization n=1 Tax=Rubripirellula amarantea TaxID=2527999 RepID=A0A5C5WST1_9BACT|nr:ThuA domain-containing protein [Rubripirellula amarantea]MDA8745619.1 ThuA domain-containing protein [Rubripirellula amarantea]TWT53133.1 Trehalose utilization [Rubripirellula amarantea]